MAPYNTSKLYEFDIAFEKKYNCRVVGVDEAGRGPLAGPVVAAAVVLDLENPIDGIFDSKRIGITKRQKLYELITSQSLAWSYGIATHQEIDEINILKASLLAMKRALDKIEKIFSYIIVDGNQPIPSLEKFRQIAVVGGDSKSASVAAASIVAKVTRDNIMKEYHEKFPQYEFIKHKGYPTKLHKERIRKLGICEIHRKTFCKSIVPLPDLFL
jgi:ribonuclease HII